MLKTHQRPKAGNMHTCMEDPTPGERGLVQETYWKTATYATTGVLQVLDQITSKENLFQTNT